MVTHLGKLFIRIGLMQLEMQADIPHQCFHDVLLRGSAIRLPVSLFPIGQHLLDGIVGVPSDPK